MAPVSPDPGRGGTAAHHADPVAYAPHRGAEGGTDRQPGSPPGGLRPGDRHPMLPGSGRDRARIPRPPGAEAVRHREGSSPRTRHLGGSGRELRGDFGGARTFPSGGTGERGLSGDAGTAEGENRRRRFGDVPEVGGARKPLRDGRRDEVQPVRGSPGEAGGGGGAGGPHGGHGRSSARDSGRGGAA